MKPEMMLVAILLPVLGGAVVPLIPFKKRIHMEIYIESVVVLTTLIVAGLLVNRPSEPPLLYTTCAARGRAKVGSRGGAVIDKKKNNKDMMGGTRVRQ